MFSFYGGDALPLTDGVGLGDSNCIEFEIMSWWVYLTHCRARRDPMRLSRRHGKSQEKRQTEKGHTQVLSPWRRQSGRDASAMSLSRFSGVHCKSSLTFNIHQTTKELWRECHNRWGGWGEYPEEERVSGAIGSIVSCIVSDLRRASRQRYDPRRL